MSNAFRSSTRVLHAPGGGSSQIGGIFGFDAEEPKQHKAEKDVLIQDENENKSNVQSEKEKNDQNKIFKVPVTDAEKVRQFTYEAGQDTPDHPQIMSENEVSFIGKMIIDEVLELFASVMTPQESKQLLKKFIDDSKDIPKMDDDKTEQIAEQADAFVDIWYYSLNAAAKKGINLSKIFDVVHNANMAKKDPISGKFLKREDGKIIKPQGWKPPDIKQEIVDQLKKGAWD